MLIDFPVSGCVEGRRAPANPSSESTLRLRIKESFHTESSNSGSEESAGELEQSGAKSVSVVVFHNTLLPSKTTHFPAFPITFSVDESDEGHLRNVIIQSVHI